MNAPMWRAWLAAIAIFVLGAAVGAAGMTWVGIRRIRQALTAPVTAHGFADRAAARIGANLTESLQLTPQQSIRLQTVLDRSTANLKAVRARAALQAAAELRAATREIADGLPPEKRAEFYRLVARRYERLGLPAPQPGSGP